MVSAQSVRGLIRGIVPSLAMFALASGCGGSSNDGGTADHSQKFEKPQVEARKVVEKPDTTKAGKELSPRERRAKSPG